MTILKASVIIPAYNASQTLERCLAALNTQNLHRSDYEIIVVDDGSDDDTPMIASRFPIRLLRQSHRGPAAARNLGASNARGEILLFTDADTEPSHTWIETMLAPFSDRSLAGAKGAYRTRQRVWMARFVQVEYEEKYARMARAKKIDVIDTYSAAYRREVVRSNGGFDESFPVASAEDQEFSFRLAKKGYRLAFIPGAIVYHRHSSNLGSYCRRKFRIGYWKAHLHRRHPDKVFSDAHTPPTLKVQVVLAPLLIASGLVATAAAEGRLIFAALLSIFAFTMIPLTIRALRQDPVIGILAPFFIASRALSLSTGFATGLLAELLDASGIKRSAMAWHVTGKSGPGPI